MKYSVWAAALAFGLMGQLALAQQEPIPDAPRPATTLPVIPSAPGLGTHDAGPPPQAPAPADAKPDPAAPQPHYTNTATTEDYQTYMLPAVTVNYVVVPFTVKDSKGHPVPGVKPADVVILENGVPQPITDFTSDAASLAVGLVVDQSLTYDQMAKVNTGLQALQGAFAPYDEVAYLTYNNGPNLRTTFTGAQSPRLYAAVEMARSTGREPLMNVGGPLSQNLNINNGAMEHIDPNTNSTNGARMNNNPNVPLEVHTLTDAIYAAAKEIVAKTDPRKYRRVIYVISDGKDYGNKAKPSEVLRYLQSNNITVYATLVHALPNLHIPFTGFVDRLHLPEALTIRNDVLPSYVGATGGQIDPEFSVNGIQASLQKIAVTARTQYGVGYYTKEPVIDNKFRTVEVRVQHMGNDLTIIAERGYYPRAQRTPPPAARPATPPAR